MIIIGVDYHPSDQYIAFVDTETEEYGERQLNHSDREAEKFYRELAARGVSVRVGMEATGYSRWFERLLAELGIEVWIGDAAEIKTKRVRKQKTDREDARLLLRLLREKSFPRLWVPSAENRDLRQLLWHRHRMVQMRTRIMNQLQALAMNEGQRRKKKLWSEAGRAELEKLPLAAWAARRRKDLFGRRTTTVYSGLRSRRCYAIVEALALAQPSLHAPTRTVCCAPGIGTARICARSGGPR